MTVRLTLETPTDAVCLQLIADLSAELAPRYGGDGSGAFSPADVAVPGAAFVVAWQNDAPVGCGALRPMGDAGVAEVKRMYVRSAARGQGISRLILNKLESVALDFGYHTVRLETGIYQTEALRLYETSSYHRINCYGQYKNNPLSICFEKRLTV